METMIQERKERRVYVSPELIVHGDIEDITLASSPNLLNSDVPDGSPAGCTVGAVCS
jgi:hypothetical protein